MALGPILHREIMVSEIPCSYGCYPNLHCCGPLWECFAVLTDYFLNLQHRSHTSTTHLRAQPGNINTGVGEECFSDMSYHRLGETVLYLSGSETAPEGCVRVTHLSDLPRHIPALGSKPRKSSFNCFYEIRWRLQLFLYL